MAADQELNASVDGKWAKQSEDANGNPLVMVNVLTHDLRLCLAQWPASEKRYEPGVLREQLAPLFERYPGRRLLTMGRPLCGAGLVPGHSRPRTGLPGAGQRESADGTGGVNRRFCRGGTWGAAGGDPGKKRA